MLNITPAMAETTTGQTADVFAIQAATRPLAGFGAGAFVCEGAWAGFRISEMAASALPSVKPAADVFAADVFAADVFAADVFAAGVLAADVFAADVNGKTVLGTDQAQAGAAGAAYKTSVVDIVQPDSVQQDTHNFIQTALLYPATRGGVGPHPVREPEPV